MGNGEKRWEASGSRHEAAGVKRILAEWWLERAEISFYPTLISSEKRMKRSALNGDKEECPMTLARPAEILRDGFLFLIREAIVALTRTARRKKLRNNKNRTARDCPASFFCLTVIIRARRQGSS